MTKHTPGAMRAVHMLDHDPYGTPDQRAAIISEETGDLGLLAALEIAAKCIRADHYPGAAETVANAIAKAHGEG